MLAAIVKVMIIYQFVRHAMSAYRLSMRHNGAQCHKDWLMMMKLSSLVCTEKTSLVCCTKPNQELKQLSSVEMVNGHISQGSQSGVSMP